MKLRPYQEAIERDIYAAWQQGARNVCGVLPTGAGKTVLFTKMMHGNDGPAIAIAHRQELVSQISIALGHHGVRHSIICPSSTVKLIVSKHMREFGKSWYDPSAPNAVAGVDTLIRKPNKFPQFTLWVQDECHHILCGNKWGKAAEMFPNARGLGVTATPLRADGRGLGRHNTGLFDTMIVGPSMRDLIDQGHLTDYRIFCPPNDINLEDVTITASGDYSKPKLKKAIEKSHVVGDVVDHYKRIANGKLGVTFATDVETATDIAAQFNAADVPAEVVSAKTDDRTRSAILERFKQRKVLQLVNVDLFGEGFDLPAIEVVSMARPTQSYSLYVQQFGRALRPLPGKSHAIIIDHVGNVLRHGLPDTGKEWTLDARERRSSTQVVGEIPVKACPACTAVFEAFHKVCPFCKHYAPPAGRDSIEFVDGDLTELDAATLAAMRGDVDVVDMDKEDYRGTLSTYMPKIGQLAAVKRHVDRQEHQRYLRQAIAWWATFQRATGVSDDESKKKFYFIFGVDVLTAQTLKPAEAESLRGRILGTL